MEVRGLAFIAIHGFLGVVVRIVDEHRIATAGDGSACSNENHAAVFWQGSQSNDCDEKDDCEDQVGDAHVYVVPGYNINVAYVCSY